MRLAPMARLVALAALVLAPALAAAQDGGFTQIPVTLPQDTRYQSVAPADVDGDGDLDLLLIRVLDTGMLAPELWRNDGTDPDGGAVFTQVPFPAPPYPATQQGGDPYGETLAWADVDGNGDVDALVATHAGTAIYLNQGGTFADAGIALPAYQEFYTALFAEPTSAAWGDVDNDGDLDLVVPETRLATGTTPDTTQVVLYLNEPDAGGGRRLVPAPGPPLPRVNRDVDLTWGDVDGDGDLDLLYLSPAGSECSFRNPTGECLVVFENTAGVLAPRALDFPEVNGGMADFGDFDLDGDLDILLVASLIQETGPPFLLDRAIVYRNDGDTFAPDTLAFPFVFDEYFQRMTAGQWADYDSDGDMDILVGAYVNDYLGPGMDFGGVAFVFANDGGVGGGPPRFTLAAAIPASDAGGTATWFDVDGDGDLDFLSSGRRLEGDGPTATYVRLLRNDAPAANAPPSPPGALTAVRTPDGVALAWAPAQDDHTPAAALTYNLRVATADGQDIVSPHARPGGGRLLPQPGNVSHDLHWALRGLLPGAYTWAVQAVDNAFNAGPFADGGTFTIGTVDGEAGPGEPAVLALAPNPSAGATRVTLVLPAAGRATVEVLDALGRRVAVLADSDLAAGAHTWPLDGARLAPGAYAVRAHVEAPGGTPAVLVGRLTVVR